MKLFNLYILTNKQVMKMNEDYFKLLKDKEELQKKINASIDFRIKAVKENIEIFPNEKDKYEEIKNRFEEIKLVINKIIDGEENGYSTK